MIKYLIYNSDCNFCCFIAKKFKSKSVVIIPSNNKARIKKILPKNIKLDILKIQKDVHLVEEKNIFSKGEACAKLLGKDFYEKYYLNNKNVIEFLYRLLKKYKWILNIFFKTK